MGVLDVFTGLLSKKGKVKFSEKELLVNLEKHHVNSNQLQKP